MINTCNVLYFNHCLYISLPEVLQSARNLNKFCSEISIVKQSMFFESLAPKWERCGNDGTKAKSLINTITSWRLTHKWDYARRSSSSSNSKENNESQYLSIFLLSTNFICNTSNTPSSFPSAAWLLWALNYLPWEWNSSVCCSPLSIAKYWPQFHGEWSRWMLPSGCPLIYL